MKKILFLLLVTLVSATTVQAGNSLEKMIKKAVKARMKELKKGGWEMFGTGLPMNAALYNYYKDYYELGKNGCEQMGNGSDSENKTVLHAKALADATRTYSTKASSNINVETVNELNSINGTDLEDFRSTYSGNVNKTIGGQLIEYYSIIRPSKTHQGCYEMQTFFLVDEREAVKIRHQALKETYIEKRFSQEMLAPLEKAVNIPVK